MAPRVLRRWLAGGTAVALAAGLAVAATAGPAQAADSTSKIERQRVDSIKTPTLDWYECYAPGIECATAKVPRDYDRPKGAKVELALVRAKARNQKAKVGSLFVNPGGPGGQATIFALFADFWAGNAIRDRFDIVGMDPRGIGFSDNLQCFPSNKEQFQAQKQAPNVWFPYTATEDRAWVRFSKTLGRACSSSGRPLSAAMSTAEVARDMEVMRRAVGDKKLNYLGFSYGSYLGAVYANMFPDRIRALAIDGVIDPAAWAGTNATKNRYFTDRLKAAESGYRSLIEALRRCDKAGGQRCEFAPGDPVKNFDLVAERLKKKPLVTTDPDSGQEFRFTYADLIGNVFASLYSPFGPEIIAMNMAQLIILTEPPAGDARAARQLAVRQLIKNIKLVGADKRLPHPYGFPYDNSGETFYGVTCTDTLNPASADNWPAYAAGAEKRVKYFGRMLASDAVPCSTNTWTARDEDAYRGPFNRATSAPLLVVGSLWDPITRYEGATAVAKSMPNSRLLTSDNWGHTAYGTSACATNSIDNYLVSVKLPAKGTKCVGDIQPFTDAEPDVTDLTSAPALQRAAAAAKENPRPFGP